MDHITQLYQNRAKVLQEEVYRLEKLLEAVKDIELGNIEEVPPSRSRELSVPIDSEAKKKKEKDERAYELAKEQYPIGAPIVGALKSTGEAIGVVGSTIKEHPFYTGAAYLLGDYLLGRGIVKATGKHSFLPITTKAISTIKSMTPAAIEAREKAEKAIEAEKLAKETARQHKLAAEMAELDRFGSTLKPGIGREAFDPNTWIEGRPQGMGAPKETGGIPGRAYEAARLPGGELVQLEPETLKRLQTRAYSGIPLDPDLLSMTGKEVGKRTADLAKRGLDVAGKALTIAQPDPLSAASEVLSRALPVGAEMASGIAMAPLAIDLFASEAGRGSEIQPSEEEMQARKEWAKEQRKQQGLAAVDSITSPTSAVDAASLGSVTVAPEDRAALEKQAMGSKTSTPNLDRIKKQREMLKLIQSGPRMFGGNV